MPPSAVEGSVDLEEEARQAELEERARTGPHSATRQRTALGQAPDVDDITRRIERRLDQEADLAVDKAGRAFKDVQKSLAGVDRAVAAEWLSVSGL